MSSNKIGNALNRWERIWIMRSTLSIFIFTVTTSIATAQTFNNVESYCAAMSEASTSTLLVRTQGITKQKAIDMMQGMTDPQAIRMVKEVIEFAYAQPQTSTLDKMRADLKQLCLNRKIFAQ